MRWAALWFLLASSALARPALADCRPPTAPCLDAEPLWLSPAAQRFATISDAGALTWGQLSAAATLDFRLRPAVLTVPAPNRDGRDVNLLRHATDGALGGRLGLGNGVELTVLLPAGLYQRGAGIKGVTDQSAPAIPVTTLHDPRVGFGVVLRDRPTLSAKMRFEAKLPLGSSATLSGEPSAVASPSLALSSGWGGFFVGAELGARLRRPTRLFGLRQGSQAALSFGLGYEMARLGLSFAAEMYLLPSLVDSGPKSYLPAEWLASARWAPRNTHAWSFGLAGGSGVPLSHDAAGPSLAFGVPSFRALLFVRVTTPKG